MFPSDEFWAGVENDPDGCWLWTGPEHQHGYGEFRKTYEGRLFRVRAHRLAWELTRGPVPANHVLHHTCEKRRCVNPDHLQAVTPGEHRRLHRKVQCINGHALVPENVYVRPDNGDRTCLACRNLRNEEHSQRLSEIRQTRREGRAA